MSGNEMGTTNQPLSADAIQQAAAFLLSARSDQRSVDDFPDGCAPTGLTDAYAVQAAYADLLGAPQIGWKVGALSSDIQKMMNTDEPIIGRIYAPFLIEADRAAVAAEAFQRRGVECEFAFRLGVDLPARDAPYTLADVAAAVASVHPAIEIVSTCWRDGLMAGVEKAIADNGCNGGLVVGAAIADWQQVDFAGAAVRCLIDGEEAARGTGAMILGDPIRSLHWLVNRLSDLGAGVAAGHYVSTGTMTGCPFLDPGQQAVGDFGTLGTVTLTFEQ